MVLQLRDGDRLDGEERREKDGQPPVPETARRIAGSSRARSSPMSLPATPHPRSPYNKKRIRAEARIRFN